MCIFGLFGLSCLHRCNECNELFCSILFTLVCRKIVHQYRAHIRFRRYLLCWNAMLQIQPLQNVGYSNSKAVISLDITEHWPSIPGWPLLEGSFQAVASS